MSGYESVSLSFFVVSVDRRLVGILIYSFVLYKFTHINLYVIYLLLVRQILNISSI
jgi:hypothetical protein